MRTSGDEPDPNDMMPPLSPQDRRLVVTGIVCLVLLVVGVGILVGLFIGASR